MSETQSAGVTAGPWFVRETPKPSIPSQSWFEIITQSGVVIGEIYDNEDGVDDRCVDIAEARANAHLVAAAPELLESLKAIHEWLMTGVGDGAALQAQSTAVIAKAEGRS